jgi:hypothetical protein
MIRQAYQPNKSLPKSSVPVVLLTIYLKRQAGGPFFREMYEAR